MIISLIKKSSIKNQTRKIKNKFIIIKLKHLPGSNCACVYVVLRINLFILIFYLVSTSDSQQKVNIFNVCQFCSLSECLKEIIYC